MSQLLSMCSSFVVMACASCGAHPAVEPGVGQRAANSAEANPAVEAANPAVEAAKPAVEVHASAATAAAKPEAAAADSKDAQVLFSLDFSGQPDGPAADWLQGQGFSLQKGMTSSKQVDLRFQGGALRLDAKTDVLGVAIKDDLKVENFGEIRIVWGVDKFPEGASYEKGVNNEAVMVYVYFGDEKLSSGSMFIPNAPYFLGLFLAEDDKIGKAYTGRHFTAGGRFVCVGTPKPGETVTTVYDLRVGFKEQFGKEPPSHLSGLNLEIDTSYVKPGESEAFIKKIEFLKAD